MTDEDIIRDSVRAAFPPVESIDVERALAHVHAGARKRRRGQRRLSGRWAPVAVALATAVILGAVLVVNGSTGRRHAPPAQGAVTGTWFRHVTATVATSAGPVTIGDIVLVHVDSGDRGRIEFRGAEQAGSAALTRLPSGVWQTVALSTYCGRSSGTYQLQIAAQSVSLTAVEDPCPVRRAVLDNSVFARLVNEDQLNG